MSVRTDVINLTVNVNGNIAQNQLNELRKRAQDVKFEMDNLAKGTQDYINKKSELAGINAEMAALKQTIGITSLTQKELTAELRKLTALKGSVVPFSQEFKDLQVQIDGVKNRLYDVKNGVTGFASFFSKINDQVKQFGVLAASYLGFQFITSQFQNIIKGSGKLTDQLADLRRVAGLTADEAQILNRELGRIDTRTATSNLRDIAIVAGKLGVAKEDIYGFTKAVDHLVVALGDELGNADEITTQLGKILNVFEGKITGDNISHLGNAIVDLANKGVATGGFIVDFTQRLSGIAKASNLSLPAILGLGAGLEENGAKVESAATAITKLINHIALDIPKAAKVAGQSVDQFGDLFAKKPQEALLAYAEGLQKNKASFAEIASSFKDAGEEGARVIGVLATLGVKTDFFRAKMEESGAAIKGTDEIQSAFELKNETLGASIDKLGKQFYQLVNSSGVVNFFRDVANSAFNLINFLKNLPQFLEENRITLSALGTALVLLNKEMIISNALWLLNKAAVIGGTIAQYAAAAATLVYRVALLSMAAVQALVTGNITRAQAAWKLLNQAFKESPIGVVVAGVIALGIALDNAFSKTTNLQKATEEFQKKSIENYGDQVNKVEQLKKALEDENVGYETKKKLYQELIAINPEFAKTLQLDITGHLLGAQAIDQYINSLKRKGEIEALQQLSNEKNKDILAAQSVIDPLESQFKSGIISTANLIKVGKANEILKAAQEAKKYFDDKLEQLYRNGPDASTKSLTQPLDQNADGSFVNKSIDDSVGAREKFLQEKIDQLKEAYLGLNLADKIGQQQNLAQQKIYEAELEALQGKEKRGKKENDLLKQAEAFRKKIDDLVFQSGQAAKSNDQKEIDSVKHKYDEILKEYDALIKKLNGKNKDIIGPRTAITDAEQKELDALAIKQQKEALTKSYEAQKITTQQFYDDEKEAQDKRFVAREISEKVYRANIAHIDEQAKQAQLDLAEQFAAKTILVDGKAVPAVEQAAKDVTAFKKAQLDQQTKDLISAYRAQEAERKLIESLNNAAATAKIETRIIIAKDTGNANDGLAAQKDLLKEQLRQSKAALQQERVDALASITETGDERTKKEIQIEDDINAKKAKLNKQYLSDVQSAEDAANQKKIAAYQGLFSSLQGIAATGFQVLNNLDAKSLAKEKTANDAKATQYKKLLDAKLISQKQYDNLIAKQDADLAKKKHEADVKAFKQQQALAITAALINGSLAVVSTLAARPGLADIFTLGAARAIQVGLVIAATAAQVTEIATQTPPQAGKGKLLSDGPYHSDPEKGLHVVNPRTGKTELLLEKDEMVIKGSATRSNEKLTVTGTPAQIGSKLNSLYGGVTWAPGAHVERPRFATQRPPAIITNMPRIMEQGGVIRPLISTTNASNNSSNDSQQLTALLTRNNELLQEQIAVSKKHIDVDLQKSDKLRGVFSIKEFNNTNEKYLAAQRASGIN